MLETKINKIFAFAADSGRKEANNVDSFRWKFAYLWSLKIIRNFGSLTSHC